LVEDEREMTMTEGCAICDEEEGERGDAEAGISRT